MSPMTALSRSMLPKTQRSASRDCGGRRSGPPCWGGMIYLPGERYHRAWGLLFLLLFYYQHFDFRIDLVAEVEFHCVKRTFSNGSFHPNHLGLYIQVL